MQQSTLFVSPKITISNGAGKDVQTVRSRSRVRKTLPSQGNPIYHANLRLAINPTLTISLPTNGLRTSTALTLH